MTQRASAAAFVRMLLRAEPWRTVAAVGLLASLGLVTGVSLLLLVPLLQLVGLDVGGGSLDRIAQWLGRGFAVAGIRPTLVAVLAAYVVAIAVNGWLSRLQSMLNPTLAQNLVSDVRRRLFAAIGRTTWVFFSRSRSSDLTHVLIDECDRLGNASYFLVTLVGTAIVAAVYVAFALRVSAVLTLLVFASGAALLLPMRHFRRRAAAIGEESSAASSRMYALIAEYLSAMKTVRAFGAADRQIAEFSQLTHQVGAVSKDSARHYANVRYGFEVGTVVMLAAIVYVAVEVRHVPTAEILLLLFLFARILPQLSNLEQTYLMFVEHLPSFAAVQALERRCLDAAEPRIAVGQPVAFRRAVDLRRVSFGYGETPAVRDVDLSIPAGETTAIVGPSGAGKSTIADLVLGLIPPDSGSVLVDGAALTAAHLPAWRDRVGYVPQDAVLFHDTVRSNLLWACPDATDEKLWIALRLAAADDFVARLPQGLDTVVGDRGVLVSGGERQRLALARALVREPSLLILDEATSALDFESERRIRDAIDRLHGRMTILLITHRLSSVRQADAIHVVDGGRIVESGTWEQLIAKPGGRFRSLRAAEGPADASAISPVVSGR